MEVCGRTEWVFDPHSHSHSRTTPCPFPYPWDSHGKIRKGEFLFPMKTSNKYTIHNIHIYTYFILRTYVRNNSTVRCTAMYLRESIRPLQTITQQCVPTASETYNKEFTSRSLLLIDCTYIPQR